jgi:hypothetical protein
VRDGEAPTEVDRLTPDTEATFGSATTVPFSFFLLRQAHQKFPSKIFNKNKTGLKRF